MAEGHRFWFHGARTICWRFVSQSSLWSPGKCVHLLSIQSVVLWRLIPQYLGGKGVAPIWCQHFFPIKKVTQQQIVRAPAGHSSLSLARGYGILSPMEAPLLQTKLYIPPPCTFFDFSMADAMGIGLTQISTIDSGVCTYCMSHNGKTIWPEAIERIMS
jgi:hypothetical protein